MHICLQRRRIAALVLLSLTAAPLPAQLATTSAAAAVVPSSQYCDPGYHRSYSSKGWSWDELDTGTIENPSKATVTKTRHHSSTETTTTTVSAGVGISVKVAVVEINGKFDYAVSKASSYTKGESITISVPPKSSVRWSSGLIKRKFLVKTVQTFSNCDTRTTSGYVYAADEKDRVVDI